MSVHKQIKRRKNI